MCLADCDPDSAASVYFNASLAYGLMKVVESPLCRRGAGSVNRCGNFFELAGHGHCVIRPRIGSSLGNRRGRPGRSPYHAVSVSCVTVPGIGFLRRRPQHDAYPVTEHLQVLFELSCLHSNHMLKDDQHIFMTRTLMRQTGLLNVGPQKVGTYMDKLGLFGDPGRHHIDRCVLLRKALKPLWPGLSQAPNLHPHSPRVVALYGSVHRSPTPIVRNAEARMLSELFCRANYKLKLPRGGCIMKRFHLHMGVEDLDTSIRFYTALFRVSPSKLNQIMPNGCWTTRVSISRSPRARKGVDHLGISGRWRGRTRRATWPDSGRPPAGRE